MKDKNHTDKPHTPKGDRLNWTTLESVQPVQLCRNLTTGKFLSPRDLSNRNNSNGTSHINTLVP